MVFNGSLGQLSSAQNFVRGQDIVVLFYSVEVASIRLIKVLVQVLYLALLATKHTNATSSELLELFVVLMTVKIRGTGSLQKELVHLVVIMSNLLHLDLVATDQFVMLDKSLQLKAFVSIVQLSEESSEIDAKKFVQISMTK